MLDYVKVEEISESIPHHPTILHQSSPSLTSLTKAQTSRLAASG